jgi:hypothetical protein
VTAAVSCTHHNQTMAASAASALASSELKKDRGGYFY